MNWRNLDLNLLTVFDAVGQERSATRAAAKLNMTQPAISHALARLRGSLQDELFVRTPDGMEPTLYAERLIGPVRSTLQSLRIALDSAVDFVPATADRNFVIAVDNRSAIVLAPPLIAVVAAEAPSVTLDIRPSGTLDLVEQLDRGTFDMAIGGLAASAERFSDRCLFEEKFAALVRRGHPAGVDGAISLEALGRYPHLILSSTHEGSDFIDAKLSKHGLNRHIAARAPLLAAIASLAQSDMIAIISELIARECSRTAPLEALRLPFQTPRLVTTMLWHRRLDGVAAHQWLRATVQRVARAC